MSTNKKQQLINPIIYNTLIKLSSCLLSFEATFPSVESSEKMEFASGIDRTDLHAKYPAKTAEKNTKRNLMGHILMA